MNTTIHLDLDGAWNDVPMPTLNLRSWGPKLRYTAPKTMVETFYREVLPKLTPFVLYGSGDFHYLAALWMSRIAKPFTLISFDNHPDWDIRPPYWGCGGWVNRALQRPQVKQAHVWGCGNFELAWPHRLFANRKALQSKRLMIHAWAERQSTATQKHFPCMNRDQWQEAFSAFAKSLTGDVYVTIDLDCLCAEDAITNWENGLFRVADLVWALGEIHQKAHLIGGDLCGAYSPPVYSRKRQAFAGNWDHPKIPRINEEVARQINLKTLGTLWPALTDRHQGNPATHQTHANPGLQG